MKWFSRIKGATKHRDWPMMLVGASLAIFVLVLGVVFAQKTWKWGGETKTENSPVVVVKEEGFPRFSDGVLVKQEDLPDHWFAVMIENSADAWPLSALSQARLVIEAPVEAGIPRFMAFFDNKQEVEKIGPVRSARPYYVEWASGYKAMYTHVGGSPEALQMITDFSIPSLNEFFWGAHFWRDEKRFAPHNVYTTVEKLEEGYVKRKYDLKNERSFFAYATEPAELNVGEVKQEIIIPMAGATENYKVTWVHDRAVNNYRRIQGGEGDQQQDADGSLVTAKNVVVMETSIAVIDSAGRRRIQTKGRGSLRLFKDGRQIKGFWEKGDRKEPLKLLDENNQPLLLNPGATWVEIVSSDSSIEVRG